MDQSGAVSSEGTKPPSTPSGKGVKEKITPFHRSPLTINDHSGADILGNPLGFPHSVFLEKTEEQTAAIRTLDGQTTMSSTIQTTQVCADNWLFLLYHKRSVTDK